MAEGYDVVVVGARCAGAPLAVLLARAGLSTCLVDRDVFPSDTPSTHGIQPSGSASLARVGVLDAVGAAAARIDRGQLAFDDARAEIVGVTELVGAPMLNIRRVTLDAILVEAATAAGAELREGTPVTGLLERDGRVAGVRTSDGHINARMVVGADGARSTVARLVGAREYATAPGPRVFLWGYFDGAHAPADQVWLGRVGENAYLASPTDGGLFMAAVALPAARWPGLRGNRDAAHDEGMRGWAELSTALEGAGRVGPLQAMSRWHGFLRESAGPGWVLTGDAGHFKDPTPGQGISDALRQAVKLAPAIEQALDGRGDAALHEWWAWRDRDAWDMYRFAQQMGAAGEPPLVMQELERRMSDDPVLLEGLSHVLNHTRAPQEVFTPAVTLRALAGALRSNPGRRGRVLREVAGLVADEIRERRPPALPSGTSAVNA